jgi:hypothetical protein
MGKLSCISRFLADISEVAGRFQDTSGLCGLCPSARVLRYHRRILFRQLCLAEYRCVLSSPLKAVLRVNYRHVKYGFSALSVEAESSCKFRVDVIAWASRRSFSACRVGDSSHSPLCFRITKSGPIFRIKSNAPLSISLRYRKPLDFSVKDGFGHGDFNAQRLAGLGSAR